MAPGCASISLPPSATQPFSRSLSRASSSLLGQRALLDRSRRWLAVDSPRDRGVGFRQSARGLVGRVLWRRVEARLALFVPGPVGLPDLPGLYAVCLRANDLLDHGARFAVEGAVQEPLVMARRRARGVKGLFDHGGEAGVQLLRRCHPVHEPHRQGLLGADVVIEQGQLFGAAQADDARQPQYRAVGNEAMARGP